MPSDEVIALMLGEGYQYDLSRDVFAPRLIFTEYFSRVAGGCDECGMAWDDSWDFCSISSQCEDELEVADWSDCVPDSCVPDDEVYFEAPHAVSGTCDLGCEPEGQFDETELISAHSREILLCHTSRYAVSEELYQLPISCPQMESGSLPANGLEIFDSVESILKMLDSMPSIKKRNTQLSSQSDLHVHPMGSPQEVLSKLAQTKRSLTYQVSPMPNQNHIAQQPVGRAAHYGSIWFRVCPGSVSFVVGPRLQALGFGLEFDSTIPELEGRGLHVFVGCDESLSYHFVQRGMSCGMGVGAVGLVRRVFDPGIGS